MITISTQRLLTCALCLGAAACTTPHPDAKLPEKGPYVAVLSGEMPPPIDRVARHAWIVVQPAEGPNHRYEYGGSGSQDPFDDFAAGDVMLHGVVRGTPEEIAKIDACLAEASKDFYQRHPDYFPIPGPNSNTFVAHLDRACSLMIELPATAIGRDYVGIVGADITEAGTGVQIGSIPFGLRVGLREGVGVQIFGLPLGVHFWPPGIDLPVNPGRLGFGSDGHIQRTPRDSYTEEFPDEIARSGAASVTLQALGLGVLDPDRARGLEGIATLGIDARLLYGKYVGYAIGFDLEMGLAFPAGLTGMAHFYPVGVGVLLSQTGFLGLFGGFGASGVAYRIPSAVELPVEARLELDIGPTTRVGFFAREAFAADHARRARGAFDLGELSVGMRVRIGKSWGFNQRGAYGTGWFFGAERREISGSAMVGAVFGTEIDAGYSAGSSGLW